MLVPFVLVHLYLHSSSSVGQMSFILWAVAVTDGEQGSDLLNLLAVMYRFQKKKVSQE